MIYGYSWTEYLWYFLIYSFLGWCVEVIYCTLVEGKVVNRGFMNGPVCPIYGCGMLMVIVLTELVGYDRVQNAPGIVLFLVGMFLASSIELFAGWLMMKLFKTRWWDYSKRPFNIGGYICLQFSVIWGLGILGTVRLVHEPLALFVESNLPNAFIEGCILIALFAVFLLDFVLTVVTVAGFNKRLTELDEINRTMRILSDRLSESIGTKALETNTKMKPHMEEAQLQATLVQSELKAKKAELEERTGVLYQELEDRKNGIYRELEDRKNELYQELEDRKNELYRELRRGKWFGFGRILRAFPSMRHLQHDELLKIVRLSTEKMIKSPEEMAAHHIE